MTASARLVFTSLALQLSATLLALSFNHLTVLARSISLTTAGTAPAAMNGATIRHADVMPLGSGGYGALRPTTYYVDNCVTVGSDSNKGTSPSIPWLTLARVNRQTLVPGDSVLLEKSCAWHETLEVPNSGSSGSPIKFGSYGTGAKPIISGSDIVSPFVADSISSIWDAAVATQPNEVWIDGQSLGPAVAAKRRLISHNQWFWRSGVLSIYSKTTPSSLQIVEAADRNYPVYISAVNYITLTGLEVDHANKVDIFLRDSTYDVVGTMAIHDTPGQGVYVGLGGGGHTIENCEIYNTGSGPTFGTGSGIQLNGKEAPPVTVPSIVQNNYIHNVGSSSVGGNHAIYDEVSRDIDRNNHFKNIFGGTGMKVDGDGIVVYGNVFDRVPSGGVWIDAYSNVKVLNNTFYDVGTVSPYAAISFIGDGAESGVNIANNIDYNPHTSYSIFLTLNTSAVGVSSDYNDVLGVWYGSLPNGSAYANLTTWNKATGQDAHSMMANPRFINAPASRFLLSRASPALGRGLYVPGMSTANPPNIGAQ